MTPDIRRWTILAVALAAAVALAVTVLPTFAQAQSEPQMSLLEGDRDPAPPRMTCEEQCKLKGERVLQACLDQGIAPERCEKKAAETVRQCLLDCPPSGVDPKPPEQPAPVPCAEQCRLKGQRVLQACLDKGGTPERCKNQADQMVRECLATCPRDGVDPNPPVRPVPTDCEGACKLRGRELYKLCIDQGGTPDRCERRAKQYIEQCIREKCPPKRDEPSPNPVPPVRPDPNACVTTCQERGKVIFQECLDRGNDPAFCRETAANYVKKCIENRCPPKRDEPSPNPVPPVRPDPNACVTKCQERGKVYYDDCVAKHGDEVACRERAAKIIDECIANCPKPVEPPTCKDACTERGKALYDRCVADGNEPAACREKAGAFIKDCIAKHCPPASVAPPSDLPPEQCKQYCTDLGQRFLRQCLDRSLAPSPEACRQKAADLVKACIADRC